MKNRHLKYTYNRKSFFGKAAALCLILSIVFRAVGGLLNRTIFEDRFATFEFALPILCALLYLLCLICFGRRWFKITVFPFVLGVMACVVRLFSYDNLMQQEMPVERILVTVFFLLILTAVYSAVAFNGLRARILLFLLFLVPLGYHAVFEIYPMIKAGYGLNASLVMMELSVLSVIFAMLFVSLALSSKPRITDVDPDSGKTVVPPLPGDKLDEKPPVVTGGAPAQVPEKPEPAPEKPAEVRPELEVVPESEKEEAGSLPVEAPAASVNAFEEPEYDPFAPSSGPIKLTLNPDLGFDNAEGEDA